MTGVDELHKVMEEFHVTSKALSKKKENPFRKMEYFALNEISCNPGISMQELGEVLDVRKPRVTAIVTKLLDKNLVEQIKDTKDKRIKKLILTKKGNEIIAEHKKKHRKFFESIWNEFSEDERKMWLILMNKMNLILKNYGDKKEDCKNNFEENNKEE